MEAKRRTRVVPQRDWRIMKLGLFRDRLTAELAEIERLLKESAYIHQQLQVNLYVVAALLRRMVLGYPKIKGFDVEVEEWTRDRDGRRHCAKKNPSLMFVAERMLHYVEFVPAWTHRTRDRHVLTLSLLSDRDHNKRPELYKREMGLDVFLDVAKRIVSDDAALLSHVVIKVREVLREAINTGGARFSVLVDYLYDGFDLLRRLPSGGAPQGNLCLFHEEWIEGDSPKCVVGSVGTVTYEKAIAALLNVWWPVPVGEQLFKIDEYPGTMLRLESRETQDHDGPRRSFLVRVEDLKELMERVDVGRKKG